MAEYVMKLTNRHPYPAEAQGSIYPAGQNAKRLPKEPVMTYRARLDAWAEFTIPADCTQLRVYMSGYKQLWYSIRRVCARKGIMVEYMFPRHKSIANDLNSGKREPLVTDFVPVRKLKI